jgi:ubiquinone/menaquinone biosynthesis C-methylase UbiE
VDYLQRHLAEMPAHRAILRAVECKLMSRIPLVAPILDVGAGDGHFASVAFDTPIDVALEPRESDLREALARPGVYRAGLIGSATQLPFPDRAFNTVVSNCVIEHIPDVDATLGEIARVLAPGGAFGTTLPSEHFADFLLGSRLFGPRYGQFFNRISHHHHIHPPAWWKAKLESLGLHVVEQRYYFSPRAHRAFDMSHYASVPNLVTRLATGKWVLNPAQMKPFEVWLRKYYEEPWPAVGAYQFVRCERV